MMTSFRRWRYIDFEMMSVFAILVIFGVWMIYQQQVMRRNIARNALQVAIGSGLVAKQVGSSVSMGRFISGRVIGGMDSGTADLEIPIWGPKGSGTLVGWLQNGFAGWHVCSMYYHPKDGPDVVIVPDETSTCERE